MRTLDDVGTAWPLWIDGRADHRLEREKQVVTSPADGRTVATVEQAQPDDIERTVESASATAKRWAGEPAHARAAVLNRAADAFDRHIEIFVESLIQLIGKPRRLAEAEARRGSDLLRRCAAELSSLTGETLPLDAVPGGQDRLGLTWREPLGVVAAVTPFNAPINLMMQKVAPALAMGNTVIVKPSPEAAVVTLQVAMSLADALPAGVLSVLCGGADVGRSLTGHDRVDAVSLTGGVEAGRSVLREAGIKPILLELGSNAPNLVLADADLDDAAKRISGAAFGASGQQCISAQRVIVEQSALDEFLAGFVTAAESLIVGDPRAAETDIGPLIHQRSREHIDRLIDDAERHGGRIVLDGRTNTLYYGPTIIVEPGPDAAILREEVFGPVVAVMAATGIDHAVEIANSTDLGLQAACFTRDIDAAMNIARRLHTGSIWINEASRFRLDTYPFGGAGKSGIGREGVRYAMEELSHLKFVGLRLTPPR